MISSARANYYTCIICQNRQTGKLEGLLLPGKYGAPRIDVSLLIGMLTGLITSIIESVGDYCSCARICQVPNPPKHAINRGESVYSKFYI